MPTTQTQAQGTCPCGSEKSLSSCCLPLIQGKQKAETAEELLKARYTAFTRGDVDFILSTHHSKTREQIKREEVEEWSKGSDWVRLQVVKSEGGQPKDEKGMIQFLAQYRVDGKMHDHWEVSQFEKENGEWRFYDAQALKPEPIRRAEPKTGRNDPCSCGSGKKFKKCCG